jgi:hypothetical protein
MAEEVNKLREAFFMGALILLMGVLPSWPYLLPKAPPPNTLGLRF